MFFSYWLFLPYRRYVVMVNKKPSGWFHLTIVYNNYDNDYNMEVYYDAEAVGTMHTIADTQPSNASSGNMTIGRLEYDWRKLCYLWDRWVNLVEQLIECRSN